MSRLPAPADRRRLAPLALGALLAVLGLLVPGAAAQARIPAAPVPTAPAAGATGGAIVADARTLRLVPGAPAADAVETFVRDVDNRTRVTNTTVYPASAVGYISTVNDLGQRGRCTGFLIGVRTVATAAHCLHGGKGRAYFLGATFYPARNGSATPFGACGGGAVWVPQGWISQGLTAAGEQHDYGVYKLPNSCSTIGNRTGWLGLRVTSGSQNGAASINHGYPSDRPSGTQWRSADTVRATSTTQLFYGNSTATGMSGGPVFNTATSCGACAVGIHAYGFHGSGSHRQYNHGTRVTSTVFRFLTQPR